MISTHVLRELVRDQPRYRLVHNLSLVIDALDRQESFPQAFRVHHVELPLGCQTRAVFDEGRRNLCGRGKGGEEEGHAQGIVNVADCVYEGRIPKRLSEQCLAEDIRLASL